VGTDNIVELSQMPQPPRGVLKMKFPHVVLAIALGAATGAFAQAPDANGAKPDNTRVNQQNRAAGDPTADQQKNNRTDLDLTRDIRRSIMEDKSLSSDAHNVKIISQNGTVTLAGPVKSEDEKKAIVSKAISAAGGADKVIDQMSVKQ
jgi:hyperosmotically inducible periplasmic protein